METQGDGGELHQPPESVKIGLCLVATDHVFSWFAYDLARMVGRTIRAQPDIQFSQFLATGCWLPDLRERATDAALKANCTHLLYLDSDMRFPATTALELLARDQPIVAANYTQRKPPFQPVAVPSLAYPSDRLYTEAESTGLEQVEAVGLGVFLIQANVVQNIPRLRFGNRTPEDLYFCMQIKSLGVPIWIDQDLSQQVTHIGLVEFEAAHAVASREPKLVST